MNTDVVLDTEARVRFVETPERGGARLRLRIYADAELPDAGG